MKKKLIPALVLICFAALQSSAQTGEKKGWPSKERYAFISECIKAAQKGMSEDTARFYCYCMIFKMEEKYPTVEEAATISEDKLASPEWQKEIQACLQGYWSSKDRNDFLKDCINSAKDGLGADRAKNYCECMLYKIEVMYPDSGKAAEELTEEKINSPDWKKIIQSCLEF
jgi:hypothetical protein